MVVDFFGPWKVSTHFELSQILHAFTSIYRLHEFRAEPDLQRIPKDNDKNCKGLTVAPALIPLSTLRRCYSYILSALVTYTAETISLCIEFPASALIDFHFDNKLVMKAIPASARLMVQGCCNANA